MPADRDGHSHPAKGSAQVPVLDRDEIAIRAYRLYEARGGGDGYDVEDWIHAEQELTREKQQKASRPRLPKPEAA